MSYSELKKSAQRLQSQASFLVEIANNDEYEQALALIETLIDDYDNQRILIELLSHSIERWENSSADFAEFNERIRQGGFQNLHPT